MSSEISEILEGTLGRFWTHNKEGDRGVEQPGYVNLTSKRFIELQVLDGRPESGRRSAGGTLGKMPAYATGATSESGVLLCRPTGHSSSRVSSESRSSTRRYRFQTAVSDVNISKLKSNNFYDLQVHFPEVLPWAGMSVTEIDHELYEDKTAKAVSIRVGGENREDATAIGNGLRLRISPHWSVNESEPETRIRTSLAVRVTSRVATPIDRLLDPVLDVQLLLSLANDGWVQCREAGATCHTPTSSGPARRSQVWDRQLLQIPEGAQEPGISLFSYDTLGGIDGVRRWLRMNNEHPKFIRTATMRPLLTGMMLETRLMETYAAIEYYVAANKGRSWAPRGRGMPALVLANHASSSFRNWIRKPEDWSIRLHNLYNAIKHQPTSKDPLEIYWFCESAHCLITSICLDYASKRAAASRSYFSDHRIQHVGKEIRALL